LRKNENKKKKKKGFIDLSAGGNTGLTEKIEGEKREREES
jgi:hypothetical protein